MRFRSFFERAERGEELTVGFFGGSITQGALSSSPDLCYAALTFERLQRTYPRAALHYVNGGIGGTDSWFGVARVQTDLLQYGPDLVIVDFSVNDEPTLFYRETYEGLLRRIIYSDTRPAVLLLNNVYYDTGKTAEALHAEIGAHYKIPHVSIRNTVYQRMLRGEYQREELTPDGLHPNDLGHRLLSEEVFRALKAASDAGECPVEGTETTPLTMNRFERTKRLTTENARPVLEGFRPDPEEKKGHLDTFKNGWIGRNRGDRITFSVQGSCIGIQYRKTVNRPAPKAKAVLDGEEENAVLLDGSFSEDWGDCLYLEPLVLGNDRKEHSVRIEITETSEQDREPFYLLSILTS